MERVAMRAGKKLRVFIADGALTETAAYEILYAEQFQFSFGVQYCAQGCIGIPKRARTPIWISIFLVRWFFLCYFSSLKWNSAQQNDVHWQNFAHLTNCFVQWRIISE